MTSPKHYEAIIEDALQDGLALLLHQIPVIQKVLWDICDTILAPKVVLHQLTLVVALEAGLITLKSLGALYDLGLRQVSTTRQVYARLAAAQAVAETQDEWMDLACQMDALVGNDVWRSTQTCRLYEADRIRARIDELVHLVNRGDVFECMYVLRGALSRNKFGLLHQGLFTKALGGTKVLVETYHDQVCKSLEFCAHAPSPNIPTEARLAFFNETRHSYGRTALLLSGGAALGFYHIGVVKTLVENGLMPRVLGGSSAGSIVCAMIGTRTDAECRSELFHVQGTNAPGHSGNLSLSFFRPIPSVPSARPPTKPQGSSGWMMAPVTEVYYNTAGAFHDFKLTLQGFVPIPLRRLSSLVYDLLTGNRRPQDVFKSDTDYFRECVRQNVGNFTFQEAFDRTGRILNIVVTPQNASDPPRLLNYLTAPHVLVWSAAVASSSLPGVFEANRLVVKEADGWERYEASGGDNFSDGSMESDLPMQQLSEMFNVNHFIISQANPHAVMFASYNNNSGVWTNPVVAALEGVLSFCRNQVRSWLFHLIQAVGNHRATPLFATSRNVGATFFTQEYEGRSIDISLIPWLGHRGLWSALLHIIYNPSEAEFRVWIQAAARETWRHIPAIKSHIAEEVMLDSCVQKLRKQILQESYAKHKGIKGSKLNERVPSFFNSPSLVNMGGLNVADQHCAPDQGNDDTLKPTDTKIPQTVDVNSGWHGMGLRGNRSSGNLARNYSEGSGLFIEESNETLPAQETVQTAGEATATATHPSNKPTEQLVPIKPASSASVVSESRGNADSGAGGYIKTSSMAHFYYRNDPRSSANLSSKGSQPSLKEA